MTHDRDHKTVQLLSRVAKDDLDAVAELLDIYRPRIRTMVAIRMDQRLTSRLDASDIIQEAFLEAAYRLPEYARRPPVEFLPWLRSIAMNRLVDQYRRHIRAQRRSVLREELALPLTEDSQVMLAERFTNAMPSDSLQQIALDQTRRVRAAIQKLAPADREVLVLKYLEEMSAPEIAAVLGIGVRTVWRRHTRAIETLGQLLGDHRD